MQFPPGTRPPSTPLGGLRLPVLKKQLPCRAEDGEVLGRGRGHGREGRGVTVGRDEPGEGEEFSWPEIPALSEEGGVEKNCS